MKSPVSAEREKRDPALQNTSSQPAGPTMAPPPFQLQATPAAKPPGTTAPVGGGKYTVVANDGFWGISRKIYGNGKYYKDIIKANDKLTKSGKKLWPGMELALPKINIEIGAAMDLTKDRPEELRDLAVAMPQADYDAYLDGLSPEELQSKGNFLQGVDMMRTTGMTFDEMEKEQLTYMEGQASAAKQSIGEFIGGEIATRGYGGGTATDWLVLTDLERAQYLSDFVAIVAKIRAQAPQDVLDVIDEAERNGGGFVWKPEEVEINNAVAYTQNDWKIYCGKEWVDAAKADLTSVYGNLVHEMGGHNEYGKEKQGWKIASGVIDGLSPTENAKALGGSNSPYSAYGYMETEIWAELRENKYDQANSVSDHPFGPDPDGGNVKELLVQIKDAFAPKIAEAMVQALWMRAKREKRITDATRTLFAADIKAVFGIDVK